MTPPTDQTDQTGARRPRARRGEGLRLRAEILEATERLLLRTGSADAVSIRSVADAVGVTPPSIYRHFSDKDALIAEVCAQHFAALDAEIRAAVEGITDPVDRLIARGKAYVRFGVANPEPYRILFMTRPDSVPRQIQEGWLTSSPIFADVVDNARDCIDAGRLRAHLDDPYVVALGIWARVHGLTSLAISKPALDLGSDTFLDAYVDECLHGIVT